MRTGDNMQPLPEPLIIPGVTPTAITGMRVKPKKHEEPLSWDQFWKAPAALPLSHILDPHRSGSDSMKILILIILACALILALDR